jgi:ABC-type glycerol-3-phosphate transport system permease component
MAQITTLRTTGQHAQIGEGSGWVRRVLLVLAYVIVIVGGFTMLVPFFWMLTTSLKDLAEALIFPPRVFPKVPVWSNYAEVFTRVPFARMILNSVVIAVVGVAGQLLTTSLAGFTFARLRFKGREFLFLLLLVTLMVPGQVTLVPQYILFQALGWVNTYYALTVPFWLGGAFGTFLMRQYFLTIPQDLVDAARVDGCNPFRVYWQIFMPLSGPVLATLAIFTFLGRWNDLLGPLIYLNKVQMMTVTVGISYFTGQYWSDMPLVMAASLISMLPTLTLFFAAQKYFVQGVVLSGMKG